MKILAFNGDSFAKALSNDYTKAEVIESKNHFKYFKDYLGNAGLNAVTFVVEDQYISKDFLQDYASYYAFCFKGYDKFCKRLHFFNTTVTEDLLNKAILDRQDGPFNLWDSYLGFIVVKPIPSTIIGYTVLRDYNFNNPLSERLFWGLRDYHVHVFGQELRIKSLAFQEQDNVLAACATTAIWSMLNKAAMDFHTTLKSPSQITRDADNLSPDGSRLFPNKGLSVLQICQAIFNSGLVSEVKPPDMEEFDDDGKSLGKYVSNTYTKKILNAYSPLGIPIILVVSVPDGEEHGLHAITVIGYKKAPVGPIDPTPEISWIAENIEKIYAHDDQWGPYTRVLFQNELDLDTPWTQYHKDNLPTRVTNIIVPLYPKVRISYEDIEAIVIGLDTMLTLFFDKKNKYDLAWDIKIVLSELYKTEIRNSPLDDATKLKYLSSSLPKYMWIATCYIGVFKIFEFTFDATDVNSGIVGLDLICYLPISELGVLRDFLATNKALLKLKSSTRARPHYYDFLLEKLADKLK